MIKLFSRQCKVFIGYFPEIYSFWKILPEQAVRGMGDGVDYVILEKLGYKVTAITSSIEALEAFQPDPESIDVIITDMTMPNMTGDKLARQIRKIRSDIPIIMCTGFSEKVNGVQASTMEINAFLMKPVDKTKFARTLRKVLDRE
jgi:CheY-like chemotaxis protein